MYDRWLSIDQFLYEAAHVSMWFPRRLKFGISTNPMNAPQISFTSNTYPSSSLDATASVVPSHSRLL